MAGPSAFAQLTSFNPEENIYSDPQDPYLFFAGSTDATAKSLALQDIYRGLSTNNNLVPEGYSGSNYNYLIDLLRKNGLSKDSMSDTTALSNVITSAVAMNQDPFTFLENYNASVKGKAIKQPDMTTQFTKQIQSSLQLKDLGDARQMYGDAYFKAYGVFPSEELDKNFRRAWNTEAKAQLQPTTTDTKYEKVYVYDEKSKPVMDKKTGEQKVDKAGQKIYSGIKKNADGVYQTKTITLGASKAKGEGFTSEEQSQFLADFLGNNFPEASWNVDDIGGTAKTVYDTIASYHRGNYDAVPDFASVSPLIKDILSTPDQGVQTELFNQYANSLQQKSSTRFMSLQNVIQPGEIATKYIAPLLKSFSTALESEIDVTDKIAIKALNFQDEKGNYRMPNEYEISQMIMQDSRYGKTSAAINESVNLAQSLKNALG